MACKPLSLELFFSFLDPWLCPQSTEDMTGMSASKAGLRQDGMIWCRSTMPRGMFWITPLIVGGVLFEPGWIPHSIIMLLQINLNNGLAQSQPRFLILSASEFYVATRLKINCGGLVLRRTGHIVTWGTLVGSTKGRSWWCFLGHDIPIVLRCSIMHSFGNWHYSHRAFYIFLSLEENSDDRAICRRYVWKIWSDVGVDLKHRRTW